MEKSLERTRETASDNVGRYSARPATKKETRGEHNESQAIRFSGRSLPDKTEGRTKLNMNNNRLLVLNRTGMEVPAIHELGEEMAPSALQRSGSPIRIRHYRKSDRDAFCRLCCDSGFLGNPVDPLFQDRELFADLFTRPYLDYEPEWIFVAEAHGQVIGYLLGSVSKHFDALLMWSGLRTILRMLARLAGGHYGHHPRSRRFIHWLLTSGFREQPKHPRDAAHLHIQIDRHYRGCGVGCRLWELYQSELRAIGRTQCYGSFFSYRGHRPEVAYSRYGFTVFDRRQTTLFQPEIPDPVEVVCVCKQL